MDAAINVSNPGVVYSTATVDGGHVYTRGRSYRPLDCKLFVGRDWSLNRYNIANLLNQDNYLAGGYEIWCSYRAMSECAITLFETWHTQTHTHTHTHTATLHSWPQLQTPFRYINIDNFISKRASSMRGLTKSNDTSRDFSIDTQYGIVCIHTNYYNNIRGDAARRVRGTVHAHRCMYTVWSDETIK